MQKIIDRAVNIATRAALRGNPVEQILWVPPRTSSQDADGVFAIKYAEPMSASETAPWDKQEATNDKG